MVPTGSEPDLLDGDPGAPDDGDLTRFSAVSAELSRQRDEGALLDAVAGAAADLCDAAVAVVAVRDSEQEDWRLASRHGPSGEQFLGDADPLLDRATDGTAEAVVTSSADVALAAPVSTTAGQVAAIVVGMPQFGSFEPRHRRLLAGVALHAGVALENARLHRAAHHEIASRQSALEERDAVVQVLRESLLPPSLPRIDGLDVAAVYLPMTEGIGGDFYDVFSLRDGEWGVVLGDVCGKGPGAAAVTALARYTVHIASIAHTEPGRALGMLNDLLLERREHEQSTLCTGLFARLQVRPGNVRITAAVAGHPPPVILRRDGSLETCEPTGPLLGLFERVDIGEAQIDLGPGDACVLYTDGATDVKGRSGLFGEERLADVIAGCRGMHAGAIATSIERAVVDFQDGSIHDDLALVVLAVPPVR